MALGPISPAGFTPRQKLGEFELKSPLVAANQVVSTLKSLLAYKFRVFTIDFALSRFKVPLSEAGLPNATISKLMAGNLDHHDGKNPGLTATEVVFKHLDQLKGNYAVVSDQVIDADNVCATFAAFNPRMAAAFKSVLTEIARYGDYYDKASDGAMKIVLTIDAMRFGKNKFGLPFFRLSTEQQGELFNDILEAMPRMLKDISQFAEHYEGELVKLKSETERAVQDSLIVPVNQYVAVVDDAKLPRSVMYQLSDRAIVISRKDLGNGRFTYNPVGLNPRVADHNLSGLWERIRALENSERANKGLPPLDVSQSWGGREVAGGSPKDETIGSILTLNQLADLIREYFTQPSSML